MRHHVTSVAAILWLVPASHAGAQIPVLRISEATPAAIGPAICGIGDLDGDTVEDLAMGGTEIRVYSGATGALLAIIPVAVTGPDGVTGPGDIDADGVPDIAFGIPGVAVRLVSGATLGVLWNAGPPAGAGPEYGTYVRAIADADGDGRRDLGVIVSAGIGSVFLSSATGIVIPGFAGPGPLRDAGDVDGDNLPDWAVGPQVFSSGPGFPVIIPLLAAPGPAATWTTLFTGGIGDVDGDGYDDLGHMFTDFSNWSGFQVHLGPAGVVGSSPVTASWGLYDFAPLGDLDGDGAAEFLRSTTACVGNNCNPGYVQTITGTAASVRSTWPGEGAAHVFGYRIARLSDLNGDGLPDFAASAVPGFQAPGDPYVKIFHTTTAVAPAAAVTLYPGFGFPPPFTWISHPLIGGSFPFQVSGAITLGSAVLLFASLPVSQPFLLGTGGEAWVDPPSLLPLSGGLAAGNPWTPSAVVDFSIPVPPIPALFGVVVHIQAVIVDSAQPAGYALSAAYRLTLGNSL